MSAAPPSLPHCRYITNRFLPDKAIDLVDEACSNLQVRLSQGISHGAPSHATLPHCLRLCLCCSAAGLATAFSQAATGSKSKNRTSS